MKVASIEVYVLKNTLEQPFAFSQGWVRQRSATLVRIVSEDGLSGWGEAFAQGLEPPEISAAVIEYALKPLVLGMDARDTVVLWHRMYHATRDYGRKGTVLAAISAVDIALWDLAGQHYSEPVYRLLGGAQRLQVQPYATGFYRVEGQGEAARLADEANRHMQNGFTAMKVKLGFGLEDDIHVIEAVAGAIGDSGAQLMVDTNHAYGRSEALQLGRVLERLGVRWYEEPVAPEDMEGYRWLRDRLDIAIAGGENEHSPYGFCQLFRHHAVDIAQPDIGSCGGFTAVRDIVALAQANGVFVNPHVWGSAVAQAASLQLMAALPVVHHSLFHAEPLFEYDQSDHPFRQELIADPWQMSAGIIRIEDKPGLGIDVNLDVVDRYRTNGALL